MNKTYTCTLLLTALLGNTSVHGQMDSLKKVLIDLSEDTSRLPVLKELVRQQVFAFPDSALPYALAYYELARTTDDQVLQGEGANFIGLCYQTKNDHREAMEHYMRALEHFELGDDPWFTAMLHNNIGAIHQQEFRYGQATKWYTEAFEQFTALNDTVWTANVSNNIANVYYHTEKWDSAAMYYSRSIEVLEAADMPVWTAAAEMNLANTLVVADSAEKALVHYKRALDVLPPGADAHTYSNTLVNLGHCYNVLGENDSALVAFYKGLDVARESGLKEILLYGHEGLSKTYEDLGMADSALANLKAHIAWKDSIYSEEKSAQIAELQEKYDSQKKDLELERNRSDLTKRDIQNKALASGALLLLLAGSFAYRAYRVKKKGNEKLAEQNAVIEKALSEKELLLREIHHRVKNNLQVISSLLSLQSRKISDEKALEAVTASRNRVKSMALIHQNLYREEDLAGIDMVEYIGKLSQSLMDSYQVNEDKVEVRTDIERITLDVDTTIPLGLILNELITNALKYAFPNGMSGEVFISLKRNNGLLVLEVRDNGVGYDPEAVRGEESTSFGFNMIEAFARKLKAEWDVRNDNGTVVSMKIQKFKLAS